jgi:hypothetical protein
MNEMLNEKCPEILAKILILLNFLEIDVVGMPQRSQT